MFNNYKYFVQCSTGKDSEACVWWCYNNIPFNNWEIIFNDVDWDNKAVYEHLKYLESRTGKKAIITKSKGFKDRLNEEQIQQIHEIFGNDNTFAEMVFHKGSFPSTKRRFCTEILKTQPTIDYILDNINYDCIMVQGVRADESIARRHLKEKDDYFKFYTEPYGYDKKGKPLYHSYRRKEVLEFIDKYYCEVYRPILKLNANEVFNIIFDNNSPSNALYSKGSKRVGCFPCVQAHLSEVKQAYTVDPTIFDKIRKMEIITGSTFFPPGYIPERYCSKKAKVNVYKDDLIKLFGSKEKKVNQPNQSILFESAKSINPEERLFEFYFNNDKIPVYVDEDGDEYIIRVVKVPTVDDVLKYVLENPNQVDLLPQSTSGCVSFYSICEK